MGGVSLYVQIFGLALVLVCGVSHYKLLTEQSCPSPLSQALFCFFFSHGILIIHTYHIYTHSYTIHTYIYIYIVLSIGFQRKAPTSPCLRGRGVYGCYGNTWSNALIYIHHIAFLHTHMHIYIYIYIYIQIAIIWFCTYNM